MVAEPEVTAIMLVNGREDMTRRAVMSFMAQSYKNLHLIIYDSGEQQFPIVGLDGWIVTPIDGRKAGHLSIGALRNAANEHGSDVIVHFDSDDYSHPNRIAEQVAFLQQSGADAVGYREMLFWSTPKGHDINCEALDGYADDCTCGATGEAWLYSNPHPRYCLGTSLCYWRSAWERNPFPDTSKGEEGQPLVGWQSKLNCASISAMRAPESIHSAECDTPMMIASIHGGNTCSAIDTNSPFWKRTPEFDEYCRQRMAL